LFLDPSSEEENISEMKNIDDNDKNIGDEENQSNRSKIRKIISIFPSYVTLAFQIVNPQQYARLKEDDKLPTPLQTLKYKIIELLIKKKTNIN